MGEQDGKSSAAPQLVPTGEVDRQATMEGRIDGRIVDLDIHLQENKLTNMISGESAIISADGLTTLAFDKKGVDAQGFKAKAGAKDGDVTEFGRIESAQVGTAVSEAYDRALKAGSSPKVFTQLNALQALVIADIKAAHATGGDKFNAQQIQEIETLANSIGGKPRPKGKAESR